MYVHVYPGIMVMYVHVYDGIMNNNMCRNVSHDVWQAGVGCKGGEQSAGE